MKRRQAAGRRLHNSTREESHGATKRTSDRWARSVSQALARDVGAAAVPADLIVRDAGPQIIALGTTAQFQFREY